MRQIVQFMTVAVNALLLCACASFNSELQCPYQQGISCHSLSQINQMVDNGEIGDGKLKPTKPSQKISAQIKPNIPVRQDTVVRKDNTAGVAIQSVNKIKPTQRHPSKRVTLRQLREQEEAEHLMFHTISVAADVPPYSAEPASKAVPSQKVKLRASVIKTQYPPNEVQNNIDAEQQIKSQQVNNLQDKNSNNFNSLPPEDALMHAPPNAKHQSSGFAPQPKRTQEKISIIWMAPYVDEEGDYHSAQTIYHVDKASHWEMPQSENASE